MPALSFPDLQRKLKGNTKPSQQQPLDAASQGGQEPDAPDAKPPTPSAKDLRSVAGASPGHARVTALYHQAKAKQNAKQHAASQQPDQMPPGDPSAQQDTAGVAGAPLAGQRLSPDSPLPGASPVPHPDDDGSTGGEPVPELGHPVSQDPLYDKKTGQPLKSDEQHKAEEAAEQQAAGMGGNAPPGAAGLNGGAMAPPGMENAAAGQQMAPGMAAMGPEGLPPQPAHLPDFPHTMAAAAYLEAYRAHQQAAGRPFIASQVLADHERHVADALKQGHHVPPDVLADYAHLQPPHEHQKMALGLVPMPGEMPGVPGASGQMPPGLEGAEAQTPGAPSPAMAAPGMAPDTAPGGQPPEGSPEEEAGETPEEEAQERQGGDDFFRSDEMKNMSPDQLSRKLGVAGEAEGQPGDEEQPEGMPPAEEGMPGEQSPATQGGFTPPSQKQREGEGLEEPPPQPDKFHSESDDPEGAEAEDKPEHTPAEGGEPAAEGKEPRDQLAPKRPYDELMAKLKARRP